MILKSPFDTWKAIKFKLKEYYFRRSNSASIIDVSRRLKCSRKELSLIKNRSSAEQNESFCSIVGTEAPGKAYSLLGFSDENLPNLPNGG
jgi:hypothetical protein